MNVADAGTLVHVESIKQLKARYFRFIDTKQWEALRDVFTDDLQFYFESSTPTITSADAFVAFISERLATAVSVHHGHMPEIRSPTIRTRPACGPLPTRLTTLTTAARSRASPLSRTIPARDRRQLAHQ